MEKKCKIIMKTTNNNNLPKTRKIIIFNVTLTDIDKLLSLNRADFKLTYKITIMQLHESTNK
jgi:hypothetical protein